MCLVGISEIELRENSEEVIFEETTDENFPRLVNDINRKLKIHIECSSEWIKNESWFFSEINPCGNLIYDKGGIQNQAD